MILSKCSREFHLDHCPSQITIVASFPLSFFHPLLRYYAYCFFIDECVRAARDAVCVFACVLSLKVVFAKVHTYSCSCCGFFSQLAPYAHTRAHFSNEYDNESTT